jgi:hypothetical protein
MLIAAAPMIGGLAMKIMRSRKQKKDGTSMQSADRPEAVVVQPPVKV